jgi:hypothetical protein
MSATPAFPIAPSLPCVTLVDTLDSPLARWRGWEIRTRCADPCCPPNRLIPVCEVVEAHDTVTVRAMAGQMRCCVCAKPARNVALVRDKAGARIIQPVRGCAEL